MLPAPAWLAPVIASVALLLACSSVDPVAGSDARSGRVVGKAAVIDGDTLEVGGRRVRLHGIDAPELRQRCGSGAARWPCGRQAAQALAARIGARRVECRWREIDRWGRPVGRCRAGDTDLSAWMVEQGWALAFRRYASTYVVEEARARAAGRGLWTGSFVPPWEYRIG